MRSGGHTTVIQRVLAQRAQTPPTGDEGTTATVAVMVRVLPPPRALLALSNPPLRQQVEGRITADVLDCEFVADEQEALRRFVTEFRPVVVTDSLEFIRKLRTRQSARIPYVVYVADLDESEERDAGLGAGADDCIGRRVTDREFIARIGAAKRIAELEAVLRITLAENRKLSATDDLTRVASRRFFGKHFPREVERSARYGHALSLILCDIDHFKNVNDTHGHPSGDQVLRQFARRIQETLRSGIDWVARIGGEEFAVVLPETGYEAALDVSRRLRACIWQTAFKAGAKGIQVSASFGLCGMDRVPAGERRLAERILEIADAALYRSKHDGRNRVTATVLKTGTPASPKTASTRPSSALR
jgi:diguanylate cyclase (GGDEF)-like protein